MKWILKQLARLTLWKFEPKVIFISSGPESVRIMMMIKMIPKGRRVRTSAIHFEGGLKIPLTILGDFSEADLRLLNKGELTPIEKLKKKIFWAKVVIFSLLRFLNFKSADYPDILVLEYMPNGSGKAKHFLDIIRLYVGVSVSGDAAPFYIERLPGSGFAVLNFDDEAVLGLKEKTRARVITFGFKDGADLRVVNFTDGSSFKLSYGGSVVPIAAKNALSRGDVCAAAAAACVGLIFDLNLVEIAEGLENYYESS